MGSGPDRRGPGAARSCAADAPGRADQLQAAIAALHDDAASTDETDWAQIAGLYLALGRIAPSPVIELNRAVAVAMASGPERGLRIVEGVAATGQLDDYPYLHAAQADLLRRLGRFDEAGVAYAPGPRADRERGGAGVPRQADRGAAGLAHPPPWNSR